MQISPLKTRTIHYSRSITTRDRAQISFGQAMPKKTTVGVALAGGVLLALGAWARKGLKNLEQTKLFAPRKTDFREVPKSLENVMQNVTTRTKDGMTLQHYYVPAQEGKKTVIFCHGIKHDASTFFDAAHFLHKKGYGAFLVEYRGFGRNNGVPSEKGLRKDLDSVIGHLSQQGVKDKDIVLWGFSMGGGVATEAAKSNRFAGLILNSTFTTIKDAAKHNLTQETVTDNKLLHNVLKRVPPALMPIKSSFSNIKKIPKIQSPVLILHAKDDPAIPYEMAQQLAKASPNAKLFISEKGGHTHFRWTAKEITEFLENLS